MPKLVRLFILHGALGLGLGAVFTALLLWLDVAGLGRLVAGSPQGWLAAAMLAWFSGITFGGVQIGIAVMRLGEGAGGGSGGRRRPEPTATPVPVTLGLPRAPRR